MVADDLVFDELMQSALRGAEEIRFTKSERAMLMVFRQNPGRVISRGQLMDAVSAGGSDASDRSVDFIINRLRAKLGDSTREPRFIATRYGEGYVWVAEVKKSAQIKAFLAIGPVHGIAGEPFEAKARFAMSLLRAELANKIPHSMVYMEKLRLDDPENRLTYSLEVSFLRDGKTVFGSMILRDMQRKRIVKAIRLPTQTVSSEAFSLELRDLSDTVKEAIFLNLSEADPTFGASPPLVVNVQEASRLTALNDRSWLTAGPILKKQYESAPGDFKYAMMWAAHLYGVLVMSGPFGGLGRARRVEMEDEIEEICLTHLPAMQRHPSYLLAAADLLLWINRGHLELVEDIVAHQQSNGTSFGEHYLLLAKLRSFRGQFEDAISLFDHAMSAAQQGSEHHVYIQIVRITALLAAGRRADIKLALVQLSRHKASATFFIALLALDPAEPLSGQQRAVLSMLGMGGARSLVNYLYETSARQYESSEQVFNIMNGLVTHLRRIYGEGIDLTEHDADRISMPSVSDIIMKAGRWVGRLFDRKGERPST